MADMMIPMNPPSTSLDCRKNYAGRGRHEELGASLSRSFKSRSGKELLSYKFIDDKAKSFIRNFIIKEYLKKLKSFKFFSYPPELIERLDSVKATKWNSNKKANGYRKILADYPDTLTQVYNSFIEIINWPDKLCKILKIIYDNTQEKKEMIYSQLISLIFLYIQKGVRSKRNKDRINSKISIEGDLTPLVSDDDKGYDFLDPLNDEDIYESSLNQDDI